MSSKQNTNTFKPTKYNDIENYDETDYPTSSVDWFTAHWGN